MAKKTMTVKEFREQGYLQELNRQFLHPLGLALEVVVEEDGTMRFGEVWDSREDPEGFIFGWNLIDKEKAAAIEHEQRARSNVRIKHFGYAIQPTTQP